MTTRRTALSGPLDSDTLHRLVDACDAGVILLGVRLDARPARPARKLAGTGVRRPHPLPKNASTSRTQYVAPAGSSASLKS